MSMLNCNMTCHMKNGQRWLHTENGDEIRVEGFGPKETVDFDEEDVKKIVFSKSLRPVGQVVSVDVDWALVLGYDNVEEIEFKGVKFVHISKQFPKLKKVTLCEELQSFDFASLQFDGDLQEIVFPKEYWKTNYSFSNVHPDAKMSLRNLDKFPPQWSKELKTNLIVHCPWLVAALDYVPTKWERNEIYQKVCDESVARALQRAKTEPKEDVVRDELNNVKTVQDWYVSCNLKEDSVEESIKFFAGANGFYYDGTTKGYGWQDLENIDRKK